MSQSSNRSYEGIAEADLERLAQLALSDIHGLFARNADLSRCYRSRLMLICLCQGAAGHYVHRDRGVHDFDLWAFFRAHPDRPFPWRRRGRCDFGPSRFGRDPQESERFTGRRVDVMGRSLARRDDETPALMVQRWLQEGRTESARRIAARPVVTIWPIRGEVIWAR
jgi:hypothetical protein